MGHSRQPFAISLARAGEFEARKGCETHIFISDIAPECADFDEGYRRPTTNNSNTNNETNISNQNSDIELKFLLPNNQFGFFVYPNPGKDIFNIEIADTETTQQLYQVKLLDLTGRVVYSSSKSSLTFPIDLTSLSKGIYYIQVNNKTKKLIIQ